MGTPLFPSLVNPLGFDAQRGIFYKYKKGYLLLLEDLPATAEIWESTVFINSMLVGKFVEHAGQIVGYYFRSQFKTICDGSSLLAFSPLKAGQAKECHRVYSDESLVIVEFDSCGTLALSPLCNSSIQTILEEQ